MPTVSFTSNLRRFYPELTTKSFSGHSVAEVLDSIEQEFPGLRDYIVDDQGQLRKHVNIFLGNVMIRDKEHLSDAVSESDELYIMQALSGG